jgi:hypothetical protein
MCTNLWVCVYWLIKVMVASCDIYVLVCVSMDLLQYCVVVTCGFLANTIFVIAPAISAPFLKV